MRDSFFLKNRWTMILLLALAVFSIGLSAQEWIQLGEKVVNDRLDHDTFIVGADQGEFNALKIKVFRRPVSFKDIKIHFANGGVQDVEWNKVIPAGGESPAVDLNGDDRVVTRVDFWYEAVTPRRAQRAMVRLFGRR